MRPHRPLIAAFLVLGAIPAGAATTPDQAKALEEQLQGWFTTNFGKLMKPGNRPALVTPAGDRYLITVPTGLKREGSGDDLAVTMLANPAENGRWVFDTVKLPQPFEYAMTVPTAKEPGQKEAPAPTIIHTKVIAATQDGSGIWDPTFATPSTFKQTMTGIVSTSTGSGVSQTNAIEKSVTEIVMTPVGTDKLNLTSSGTLTGYGLKMVTPDAAGSIDLAAKSGAVSIVINGMSRDRGAEAMRAMVDLFAAGVPGMTPPKPGAPPTADPKLSPAGMAALKRLVATLPDLGSSMKLDESVSDLAVNAMGKTFAASKVGFTMDMKSVSGQLQGVMGLVAQNMVWPDLGVGDLSKLLPQHVVMRPAVSGISSQDLTDLLNAAVENGPKAKPEDAAIQTRLLIKGGTIGLEALEFDTGGATFAATGTLTMQGSPSGQPVPKNGNAHIVAKDFDKLVAVVSAQPMLAQGMPTLVFVKGLGKQAEGGLVWDLTYDGAKLAVNGTDMSAMMGGAR